MTTWRTTSVVAASIACVLAGSPAWAQGGGSAADLEALKRMVQEVVSQNEELRRRIRELEGAMARQEQAARSTVSPGGQEPAREPAKEDAKEAVKEVVKEAKGLADKLSLGGAIEVGTELKKEFSGKSESRLKLESAEFDFEAKLRDWLKGSLALEWDRDNDKLTVNEALIKFGEDHPLTLTLGRGTVPFGLSTGSTVKAKFEDTLTQTDPLTIAIFDAKEDFALLEVKGGGFHAGGYVYNGVTNRRTDKKLDHYGAAVGYGLKGENMGVTVGLSMIDSVFDSDSLAEEYPEALRLRRYTPGLAAHIKTGFYGFQFIGAYYTAVREAPEFARVDENGEIVRVFRIKPRAWHVEGGYSTDLFGQRTFGALGYSQSYEVGGAFPRTRKILTVGRYLLEDLRLTFDYAFDTDYARSAGGTGRTADAYTLRLTFEW